MGKPFLARKFTPRRQDAKEDEKANKNTFARLACVRESMPGLGTLFE